jgi:hypothetical protein
MSLANGLIAVCGIIVTGSSIFVGIFLWLLSRDGDGQETHATSEHG